MKTIKLIFLLKALGIGLVYFAVGGGVIAGWFMFSWWLGAEKLERDWVVFVVFFTPIILFLSVGVGLEVLWTR